MHRLPSIVCLKWKRKAHSQWPPLKGTFACHTTTPWIRQVDSETKEQQFDSSAWQFDYHLNAGKLKVAKLYSKKYSSSTTVRLCNDDDDEGKQRKKMTLGDKFGVPGDILDPWSVKSCLASIVVQKKVRKFLVAWPTRTAQQHNFRLFFVVRWKSTLASIGRQHTKKLILLIESLRNIQSFCQGEYARRHFFARI